MLLSDTDIRWLCPADGSAPVMIEPFSESTSGNGVISWGVTSAGYDIRLGPEVWLFRSSYNEVLDPRRFSEPGYKEKIFEKIEIPQEQAQSWPIILPPHSYVLGHSYEYFRIPVNIKARCVGRSTYCRCGVLVNLSPAEPGWEGHLTLEIGNITPCPAIIRVMEGIAQMEFETLSSVPELHYANKNAGHGGKYQGQRGVTPAAVL